MKKPIGALGILLIVGLGVPARGEGQATPSRGLDSASITLLKPSRFVRLQIPDFGRVQGTVGMRSATELTLVRDQTERTVRLAAVDSLWVRGRHTKTGAIIGAIVGIGGGVFLAALAKGLCESDCGGDATFPLAVLGAGGGLIVGGVIGAAIPRWRRVYPH